jgi:hypothetical protein
MQESSEFAGGEKQMQNADPDLARIVAAWPTLADAIRRAMLALIG